jgi:hypothetical protein
VLANGNIVNVSPTSYSDLYWALRGGTGVNFGIVSRFDLFTFEQGDLWGGSRFYPMAVNASLADAFYNSSTTHHRMILLICILHLSVQLKLVVLLVSKALRIVNRLQMRRSSSS